MILTLLWLTGRTAGSVGASVLQKRLLEAGVGAGRLWWITYGLLVPAGLALLAVSAVPENPAFWKLAIAAAVLDVAGNLAMAMALRDTDLSVFGPLNAFRPAIAGLAGWWLLDERPSAMGGIGLAIVIGGAVLLLAPGPRAPVSGGTRNPAGVLWRFLGLALSTLGASFLKRSMETGPAVWTLSVWILGGAALLSLLWLHSLRHPNALWSHAPAGQRSRLLLHAAIFLGMQWATLEIFQRTLLAYSFAFFQLGMVAQVLVGGWLFGERQIRRRLLACGVMSVGALVLLIAG
ncbi:MAG: EamA family transporter [Verrucomicrobia bacterium]|nr:EamA family transporter [Verrucomicrobiota bacterium]